MLKEIKPKEDNNVRFDLLNFTTRTWTFYIYFFVNIFRNVSNVEGIIHNGSVSLMVFGFVLNVLANIVI